MSPDPRTGVPADIQGIQRIEYDSFDFGNTGLVPQIAKYLVKEHTHPRRIFSELTGQNREKQFYFALGVLAHFRDNKRLRHADIARIARGTYLRDDDRNAVLQKMVDLGIVGSLHSANGARLEKNLFPEPIKVGMYREGNRLTVPR